MKKKFYLLSIALLVSGCAESLALLSTSASTSKIAQSSLNSAISYGVKKETGKTPLEHAIAYAEEKNPEKKKDTCISSIEKTRSEFCTVLKSQISLTSSKVKKKTLEIVQKFPKINIYKSLNHNYILFHCQFLHCYHNLMLYSMHIEYQKL